MYIYKEGRRKNEVTARRDASHFRADLLPLMPFSSFPALLVCVQDIMSYSCVRDENSEITR